MTAVLVVGGAGYIGAHACKALAAAGYTPVTLDNLVFGHREAVRWGPFVEGAVHDGALLDAVIAEHRPVAAMHFAAFTYVGESVADPLKYYRNNVGGTESLTAALVRGGVSNLVFSSTAAVYGMPDVVPVPVDAPTAPINPYGQTKLVSERMIAEVAAAEGMHFAALRYFNAAGADPDGEIGEEHDPESHLIPLALDAVAGGKPLTLFGDDYDTPDGTAVRDYIHVTDLAQAHVAALGRLVGGGGNIVANLGTGEGISVRQVLDSIADLTGSDVPHSIGPRRPGDPPVLVADVSHTRDALGWSARMSDIGTIVDTAWRWHRRDAGK